MRLTILLLAALALAGCSIRDGGVKPGDGCAGNWECTDNHSCAGGHCLQDCGGSLPPCPGSQICDHLRDSSGNATSDETVCQPNPDAGAAPSGSTAGAGSGTTSDGGTTTGTNLCCKHCGSSKPCGSSCIPSGDTCHTAGGCACY